MWIVQAALRRPYTFLVMALLILLATPLQEVYERNLTTSVNDIEHI